MKLPTHNTTWSELEIGACASLERVCTEQDLLLFAHASGNRNPLNLPDGRQQDQEALAPSMWVGSLLSALLGNVLPGPGTLYRSQDLRFHSRVQVGDRLQVTIACQSKGPAPLATFSTVVRNGAGELVCEGEAEVEVPRSRQAIHLRDLPPLMLGGRDHFAALLAAARSLAPLVTAVVCPEDANSMGGVALSAREGLIRPVLIGHPQRMASTAAELGVDIAGWPQLHETEPRAAAAAAVELARKGEAGAIMKGAIHSDELLAAVVNKQQGLRGSRRLSHVFVMDAPMLDHLLFISDAAINIAPDLTTKVDITQNAIDLARACGIERPRVGILSAVETINTSIPSTLDAAVLSKMAERGQIRGATVDGPLAMDNAIDLDAARTKGIDSLVAGRAEVLIVPNLEAGNMLAKELTFVARAEAAGLVIGARVPVILTSRSDNDRARLASCALALLHEHWRQTGHCAVKLEQDAEVQP
jgi:phosphotransacetylase/acyl dehydratase